MILGVGVGRTWAVVGDGADAAWAAHAVAWLVVVEDAAETSAQTLAPQFGVLA